MPPADELLAVGVPGPPALTIRLSRRTVL